TAGDGGMVLTRTEEQYRRAFAVHDQGHLPLRQGVEQGARAVLGLNFKMTELVAAVVLAQLKKVDTIRSLLREKKARFKQDIADLEGISFRHLPDPDGEAGTVLTVLFPTEEIARNVGKELGCGVVADSGWHVYNHMEHVLGKKTVDATGCPFTCPFYTDKGGAVEYRQGMLPRTDEILARAINISIGVADAGLGSGFGITVLSENDEIETKAEQFRAVVERYR
ncbi:MAG: DegT/DnrJ/EryC1/StrS family aminotransferase, partial [Spirochaetaceae bacterium]